MGSMFGAVCGACGFHFVVHEGGGFTFEILRCDACGRERTIPHSKVRALHEAFDAPWWEEPAGARPKKRVKPARTKAPTPRMTFEEYHAKLAEFAGPCKCGGRFAVEAPIRCPKCKSREFSEDPTGPMSMYD